MVTIDVGKSKPFMIEKCPTCGGLFFDNGELEAILEQEVSHSYHIDNERVMMETEKVAPAGDSNPTQYPVEKSAVQCLYSAASKWELIEK